jgi:hypothetical protein
LGVLACIGLVGLVIDFLPERSAGTKGLGTDPADAEAMRALVGAYRVHAVKRGTCELPESAELDPPRMFAFRYVLGELVGVPCDSVAACQSLASDTQPFRFELVPPMTLMGDPSPPGPARLVRSPVRVSAREGRTFTSHDVATATPRPGTRERLVTNTTIRPTADGLDIRRRFDFALSAETEDCRALPVECVAESSMTLVKM